MEAVIVPVSVVAFIAIMYGLPMWHVLTSPRTPRNARAMWVMMFVLFGLVAYPVWFWMRDKRVPQGAELAAASAKVQLPCVPAGPDEAVVYLVRPARLAAHKKIKYFLGGKHPEAELGLVRGLRHVYFKVRPGNHVLWCKSPDWVNTSLQLQPSEVRYLRLVPNNKGFWGSIDITPMEADLGRFTVGQTRPDKMKKTQAF